MTGALYHFLKNVDERKRPAVIREALEWAEKQSLREAEGEAAATQANQEGREAYREENREDKRRHKIGAKK